MDLRRRQALPSLRRANAHRRFRDRHRPHRRVHGSRTPKPEDCVRAEGETIFVTVTAVEGGQVTHVAEQPMPCPPAATTPGRLRSFAHGTAMAAQQLATRGTPDSLSPDEVYCPELLEMPDLATADAFRRAILDEQGPRGTIRAHRATAALAAEGGLPMPDAAGQAVLYRLVDTTADRGFADWCDAIREIVDGRRDLLPFLVRIAQRWADEPDASWADEPDTDTSGPLLLAGLLVTLLPALPPTSAPRWPRSWTGCSPSRRPTSCGPRSPVALPGPELPARAGVRPAPAPTIDVDRGLLTPRYPGPHTRRTAVLGGMMRGPTASGR